MQGLKGVIIVASIVATAAALGACRKSVDAPAMKLGAADVTIEQAVRV
ncbi:MAG: hypothetical protein ACTSP0_09465 [Alphaproteobacteria bacterium]|jgi:hypothetical protein